MLWSELSRRVLAQLQENRLLQQLERFACARGLCVFVVGGTLRDVCLGRPTQDFDVVLVGDVLAIAREFARESRGTFVPLDPERGEARIVYPGGVSIDFSRLKGADTAQDLVQRDFTVNALAAPLASLLRASPELLDPCGGVRDLNARVIRMVSPESFQSDPLRVLRGFRLAATLECTIDDVTLEQMKSVLPRIREVAPERIHREWFKLLATPRFALFTQMMAHLGLLDILFSDLAATHGVMQNRYHHLDVFEHSLQTCQFAETVINDPAAYFPQHADVVAQYMLTGEWSALLKCAALLHDIGKPLSRRVDARGRVSFPGHAERGAQLWEQAGRRLRLSVARIRWVRTMIEQHRRPFDLLRLEGKGQLTGRIVHRLFKEMGEDVLGLFVLAIADVLASRGPQTPASRANALGKLCGRLWELYRTRVLPVTVGPRLLTGDDLQSVFALKPGPRFKTILEEVEVAQVEGRLRTRQEAFRWVEQQLATSGDGQLFTSLDPQGHAPNLMIDEDGELP